MVVAGFFIAFAYPAIKTNKSDVVLATAQVYQRSDDRSWKNQNIDLDTINNPAKLKLTANFLPGTPYLEDIVRFRFVVAGPKEIVLDKTVQVHVGKYIAPRDGLVRVSTFVPQFYIPKSGSYTINVSMDEKPDFSLSSVFVTAFDSVEEPDTSMRTPGIMAFVFGMVLIFRRRKLERKQNSKSVETTPPQIEKTEPAEKLVDKPMEEPTKKKIRWGRNADPD